MGGHRAGEVASNLAVETIIGFIRRSEDSGECSWPYGIEPNRPTLQALVRYMAEQHLIAKAMPIEELFVPLSATVR